MNYINNENLLKELQTFSDSGIQTEELGGMLLLLARRYSEKGNFSGYSWKDDMIGEAVLTCVKYMSNFDLTKEDPNPFAYFSRIIHHSFVSYILKQKKHSQIKDLCYKHIDYIMPETNVEDDYLYFDVYGINYQPIRGNKKKKKRRKK